MEIKIDDNNKMIFYIDGKRVYNTDLAYAAYVTYMISKAIIKAMKEK